MYAKGPFYSQELQRVIVDIQDLYQKNQSIPFS